jgi:hypothetical protein
MPNAAKPFGKANGQKRGGISRAGLHDTVRYSLLCGIGAGIAANFALSIAGKAEGRSMWQPVNATSHWLWGPDAAKRSSADIAHTATGATTNQAAAMFWGTIFGIYLASRPPRSGIRIFLDAGIMSAIAGAVDYGMVPRRLTPGWELVLPPKSVAAILAAMALGLAAGGNLAQRGRRMP